MTVGGGIQERGVRREDFDDRSYVWVCMLYVRTKNQAVDASVITCGGVCLREGGWIGTA